MNLKDIVLVDSHDCAAARFDDDEAEEASVHSWDLSFSFNHIISTLDAGGISPEVMVINSCYFDCHNVQTGLSDVSSLLVSRVALNKLQHLNISLIDGGRSPAFGEGYV